MLESFQNLGGLISKFKETNSAESGKIDNKLSLLCLFISPFLCFWDFPSFLHSCVVLCSTTGLFSVVRSPGHTHYPLCPCSQSPQDLPCLALSLLISPLLCLDRTEACLMNCLWVKSLGVLFRIDCALCLMYSVIQRKADPVSSRTGFSFHDCVQWVRVPCLREKICFNIPHISTCMASPLCWDLTCCRFGLGNSKVTFFQGQYLEKLDGGLNILHIIMTLKLILS